MWTWLSSFLLKPLVNLVKRRMCILIVRFDRSTNLVEMCFGSGLPMISFEIQADALGRAVARLALPRCAIELHELRVIDIATERVFYRLQIQLQTVLRELHASRQPRPKIARDRLALFISHLRSIDSS